MTQPDYLALRGWAQVGARFPKDIIGWLPGLTGAPIKNITQGDTFDYIFVPGVMDSLFFDTIPAEEWAFVISVLKAPGEPPLFEEAVPLRNNTRFGAGKAWYGTIQTAGLPVDLYNLNLQGTHELSRRRITRIARFNVQRGWV